MRRTPFVTLAALLALAGCAVPAGGGSPVPSGPVSTPPAASPATSPATSRPATSPAATVQPTVQPTTVRPATTDPALDSYAGPRPMPASDGGPMLWPTTDEDEVSSLYLNEFRSGFLDVEGKLVIAPDYSWYQYCPDAAGRASFLIVHRPGRRAAVYDLSGRLLLRAPTRQADCGGAGHLIFTRSIEPELSMYNSGLLDLATGKVVLPMAPDRHLMVLDSHTVNVSEPSGEFFLDLDTGARTPHVGWLTYDATLEAGAPGLPATKKYLGPYAGGNPSYGYVGTAGTWVVPPTLDEVAPFVGGHAIVRDGSGYWFLDSSLARVGDTWNEIRPVETSDGRLVGYQVTRVDQTGLLGPDLGTLVEAGTGRLDCPWYDAAVCTLVADGHAESIALPGGERTPLPQGYNRALGPSFVGAVVGDPDDPDATSSVVAVYSLTAGRVVATGTWNGCGSVAGTWLVCTPQAEAAPPLVLDSQGRQTRFREVTPVYDPVSGGDADYYWVVAGRYRGFVDATGAWRYRESRYNELED